MYAARHDREISMPTASTGTGNRLFDALLRECRRLRDEVEPLGHPAGHVLAREGDRLSHVYFPTTGVVSAMVQLAGGGTADAMTVGNEGMVGISIWLGIKTSLAEIVQQAPGEILGIPVSAYCAAIDGSKRANTLMKRFTAYSLRFGYQSSVCNATHDVEQRACRWLLSTADRAHTRHIRMSQSLLAHILGVRRQSVGEVAVRLQRQRMIDYSAGQIRLVDRAGLERRACECYDAMNRLYGELLDPML